MSHPWRPRWAKPETVAPRRTVAHGDRDLPDPEPQPYGVDGHGRLEAEPVGEGAAGLEDGSGRGPLARQRRHGLVAAQLLDRPARQAPDDPEPAPGHGRQLADHQIGLPGQDRPKQRFGGRRRRSHVAVDQEHEVAVHEPEAGLDGGPLPDPAGGEQDHGPLGPGPFGGVVRAPVGHHHHGPHRGDRPHGADRVGDGSAFVAGGDQGDDVRALAHAGGRRPVLPGLVP